MCQFQEQNLSLGLTALGPMAPAAVSTPAEGSKHGVGTRLRPAAVCVLPQPPSLW